MASYNKRPQTSSGNSQPQGSQNAKKPRKDDGTDDPTDFEMELAMFEEEEDFLLSQESVGELNSQHDIVIISI